MPKANPSQTWTITEDQVDMRLDHFLTQETDKTRSSLKIAIKEGRVTVSGERPSVHRFLRLGDKIVFLPLGGFGFAALAGIGGGLILDYVDPQRSRKRLGWLLLILGGFAGATCLILGLP